MKRFIGMLLALTSLVLLMGVWTGCRSEAKAEDVVDRADKAIVQVQEAADNASTDETRPQVEKLVAEIEDLKARAKEIAEDEPLNVKKTLKRAKYDGNPLCYVYIVDAGNLIPAGRSFGYPEEGDGGTWLLMKTAHGPKAVFTNAKIFVSQLLAAGTSKEDVKADESARTYLGDAMPRSLQR